MCISRTIVLSWLLLTLIAAPAFADEPVSLKYKFAKGETIRWQVTEQVEVKTTMRGTTQTAKTAGTSVKSWKVSDVDAEGNATFEHMVESVHMKMWLTGRDEIEYNSTTDKEPPEEYKGVAKNVGTPLSRNHDGRVRNHYQTQEHRRNAAIVFPHDCLAAAAQAGCDRTELVAAPGHRRATQERRPKNDQGASQVHSQGGRKRRRHNSNGHADPHSD